MFLAILQFTCIVKSVSCSPNEDESAEKWYFDSEMLIAETIVKKFTWAQWDSHNQALYYIHMKPKSKSLSLLEGEENNKTNNEIELSPTLSAFQFNDKLPTETVVSITIIDEVLIKIMFSMLLAPKII